MFNLFKRNRNKQAGKLLEIEDKLEIAKKQLIFDLEKNGMEFLLSKMASHEVYSDLIYERRRIELSYGSGDSESWYAYLQSNKLSSESDKRELLALLASDKHVEYKQYIYCCLASICGNSNDKDLFNFLIDKAQVENDEKIRVSILSRLGDLVKDSTYNIEPIKLLVKEGTGEESHAAIVALSYAKDPEVEDLLINEFNMANMHMKGVICGPLSTVGTIKSIRVLQDAYKKTRNAGLRMAIDDAISKIKIREKGTI